MTTGAEMAWVPEPNLDDLLNDETMKILDDMFDFSQYGASLLGAWDLPELEDDGPIDSSMQELSQDSFDFLIDGTPISQKDAHIGTALDPAPSTANEFFGFDNRPPPQQTKTFQDFPLQGQTTHPITYTSPSANFDSSIFNLNPTSSFAPGQFPLQRFTELNDDETSDHTGEIARQSHSVQSLTLPSQSSIHFRRSENTLLYSVPKKRTRRKFKELEHGNNSFGRSGNLRCETCRKRRSKCVFLHRWSPCDYCRFNNVAAPCIKKRSPKTETRFGLSWPVPTPDDALVDSADRLLYQLAFSDEMDKFCHRNYALMIRKFIGAYGGYIPSASLRHAIIAFTADFLPPAFEQQRIDNTLKASCELRKQNENTLDDSHLLAVYLLSRQTKLSDEEELVHAIGLRAMINILQSSAKDEVSAPNNLACLRPYFVEMLLPGAFAGAFESAVNAKKILELIVSLSTSLTSWDGRLQVLRQLYDSSNQIPNCTTIFQVLYWDLCDIISLLHLFQKLNMHKQSSLPLGNLLARWKGDVDNEECGKLLGKLEEVIAAGKPLGETGDYLPDACVLCVSVRLLVLVLESNVGISEALRSPEAVSLSWLLVSFIRLHDQDATGCVLLWRYALNKLLFLGGAALSPSVVADGSSWILESLKADHGDEDCDDDSEGDGEGTWEDSGLCFPCFLARRLQEFWRTSDEHIIVTTLATLGPAGSL